MTRRQTQRAKNPAAVNDKRSGKVNIGGRSGGLSRRTMLKGLGVTMALPLLDTMLPSTMGSAALAQSAGGASASTAPVRMAYVFMPNGVNYEHWTPTGTGRGYRMSPTLEGLADVREHVNILSGLTLDKARANGDGPGDHARSSATFLTGAQARKTAGNDIRIGVSVDQFAAAQVGAETRLPSLELGTEAGRRAGNCDSGYSCAYSTNIAWRDEDSPVPKMIDPASVFELMFGDAGDVADAGERQEQLRRRGSVLDYVQEDTRRLERQLGVADQRKIEEFQNAIREIERRVEQAMSNESEVPTADVPVPDGIPREVGEHIDLMYDMMLLAFRMDITRVSTYMLGIGGSNRTFSEIDVREGHHSLSHHKNNQRMIDQIRKIDRFQVDHFARFVQKLAETEEGDGTLLDNCMVMLGSGISDGNRHNHHDLPIVMAGKAGGAMRPGQHLAYERDTPLCGLYMSMLQTMGCDVESFGDANAPLRGLMS